MRQVKVKFGAMTEMVPVEQDNTMLPVEKDHLTFEDAIPSVVQDAELEIPMLSFSSSTESTLSGFGDSAHVGTFDLVLDEFNAWLANGAPNHQQKVFKFL